MCVYFGDFRILLKGKEEYFYFVKMFELVLSFSKEMDQGEKFKGQFL